MNVRVLKVSDQQAALERIKVTHPHSIVAIDDPAPIETYTCGVYAFHFIKDPDYEGIARQDKRMFAGEEFVHFLIDNKLLRERQHSEESEGDLVIYFKHGRFAHVGLLLANNRVRSKWGIGYLYEHDRWEVPESYGTETRVFFHPGGDESRRHFIDYACSKGFSKA